ncbi:hypothetical protein [Aliarcobacter butzleri]|uniref:hypothetical protein n=1 Tax=Aliarcobacter butzleri TaxID=28197 RepID=UPI003B221A9F
MDEKLKKFMDEEVPKRNISIFLQKIKEELVILYDNGYSMEQLANYIKKNYQIKTSRQTISNLIKGE